jgi:hypothetical protein
MPRGEDICFTDRARELGYKVYVDWKCKVGHQKPFLLAWPTQMITGLPPDKWAKLAFPGAKIETKGKARKPRKRAKKGPKSG